MSEENLEALCKHCGQTLSTFLHQMEEHNAKVVCPSCGKTQDEASSPGETEEAPNRVSDARQTSPVPGKKRLKGAARPRSQIKP